MNLAANVREIAIEIKIRIPIYYIRPPILIIRIISIIRDSPKRSNNNNNNNNNNNINFIIYFCQNLSSTFPGEDGLRALSETLPKNKTLHILRLECE